MSCYLLYDHLDHLLDEADHAQHTRGQVQAYIKLHEQHLRHDERVTLSTAITVTWMQPVERIIHAARMLVDTIDLALDDPHRERHEEALLERSRVARSRIMTEFTGRGITPDYNLVLLTAGLREQLAQLQTEQLVWAIISGDGPDSDRQLVLLE